MKQKNWLKTSTSHDHIYRGESSLRQHILNNCFLSAQKPNTERTKIQQLGEKKHDIWGQKTFGHDHSCWTNLCIIITVVEKVQGFNSQSLWKLLTHSYNLSFVPQDHTHAPFVKGQLHYWLLHSLSVHVNAALPEQFVSPSYCTCKSRFNFHNN